MASTPSNFVVDADLHGLVDGHIEADRRADALRRLAGSPSDRAKVEAWQSQNDLLRSAFAGIDREPLPAILDLRAKPRLQCIAANDSPLVEPVGGAFQAAPRQGRFGVAVATILLIALAVGATWAVLNSADPEDTIATPKLRGSVDAALASRSADAISRPAPVLAVTPLREGDRLPTSRIPDLRDAGFSFISAEIDASDPASILFRYQNGMGERVAVSVAYAAPQDEDKTAPVRIGNAYSWRKRDHAFSIAGTLRPGRLRAMALALLNDDAKY